MRVPVFIAAALTACLAVCAPGTSRGAQLFTTLDFQFEDGSVLPDVHIAYETHGTLSPARDNAILLIPGAIGDRHVFDWAIGSGKIFDTDKYVDVLPDLTLLGCYAVANAWIEFPQRLQGVRQGGGGLLNNDLAFPGGERTQWAGYKKS